MSNNCTPLICKWYVPKDYCLFVWSFQNISLLFRTWGIQNYFIIFVCFFQEEMFKCQKYQWNLKNGKNSEKSEKQETKKNPSRLKLMNLLDKKCSTQNYLVRTISEAKSGNTITTVAASVREAGGFLLLSEMNLQRKVWNMLSRCYSPTRSLDTCT